jgi:hypothetical protein
VLFRNAGAVSGSDAVVAVSVADAAAVVGAGVVVVAAVDAAPGGVVAVDVVVVDLPGHPMSAADTTMVENGRCMGLWGA